MSKESDTNQPKQGHPPRTSCPWQRHLVTFDVGQEATGHRVRETLMTGQSPKDYSGTKISSSLVFAPDVDGGAKCWETVQLAGIVMRIAFAHGINLELIIRMQLFASFNSRS